MSTGKKEALVRISAEGCNFQMFDASCYVSVWASDAHRRLGAGPRKKLPCTPHSEVDDVDDDGVAECSPVNQHVQDLIVLDS